MLATVGAQLGRCAEKLTLMIRLPGLALWYLVLSLAKVWYSTAQIPPGFKVRQTLV